MNIPAAETNGLKLRLAAAPGRRQYVLWLDDAAFRVDASVASLLGSHASLLVANVVENATTRVRVEISGSQHSRFISVSNKTPISAFDGAPMSWPWPMDMPKEKALQQAKSFGQFTRKTEDVYLCTNGVFLSEKAIAGLFFTNNTLIRVGLNIYHGHDKKKAFDAWLKFFHWQRACVGPVAIAAELEISPRADDAVVRRKIKDWLSTTKPGKLTLFITRCWDEKELALFTTVFKRDPTEFSVYTSYTPF